MDGHQWFEAYRARLTQLAARTRADGPATGSGPDGPVPGTVDPAAAPRGLELGAAGDLPTRSELGVALDGILAAVRRAGLPAAARQAPAEATAPAEPHPDASGLTHLPGVGNRR
jgi:hypothetical protein